MLLAICLASALACVQQTSASAERSADQQNSQRSSERCRALETREPNASGQEPAFAGQTRACGVTANVAFDVVTLTDRLEEPWSVEPLPGGDLLVTEKGGTMRIVTASGQIQPPIAGVPEVDDGGQGGLLDVALSPSFASDRTIYWSYSEPREGGNATSVARAVLSQDRKRLEKMRVIFRAMPTFDGHAHFGSRLNFGPDGMLYITLGERSSREIRPQAQHLDSHMGKIIRIAPDGSVPKDNPFTGRKGARPEIWSLGHRNVQAADFDPQGRLWIVDHGPQGGDELNRIEKGKNYGWPLVTFGEEYSGRPISNAVTTREGFADPVYYWDPVIAPSGAEFYTGDAFPAWKGSLFVGALREQRLVRLVIENDRVKGEEHLLADRGERVRDVKQGPDGALYIVTDAGSLWKLVPKRG
jgi:glucose/arabinose dehydrogenase